MTKPNTSRKSNYAMLKEGHDKEMVEAQKEIDKLKEMLDSTNKVCKDLLEKDTANGTQQMKVKLRWKERK